MIGGRSLRRRRAGDGPGSEAAARSHAAVLLDAGAVAVPGGAQRPVCRVHGQGRQGVLCYYYSSFANRNPGAPSFMSEAALSTAGQCI